MPQLKQFSEFQEIQYTVAERFHDLEHFNMLNNITESVRCNKSGQQISRSNLKCPEPKGRCKYRENCVIYAFGQFEKFDS